MEDARFDELIGPLVEAAYARGVPDATIQDAAVAAWRALPRLKTGEAAAEFFERKLGKASPSAGGGEGFQDLAAETLALARAHARRPAAVVHAPLVAAGLAVLVAVAALAPHALAAPRGRPHLPATGTVAFTPGGRLSLLAPTMPPRPQVPIPYVGRAPAGEPLIWTTDDFAVPSRLLAFDLQGRPVASLPVLSKYSTRDLRAGPNGDVLWLGDHFVDRWGNTLDTPAWNDQSFIWSDRPDRVCGLSDRGALWTYRFGGAIEVRHQFGATGLSLVGCSFDRDLALLTAPGGFDPGTPIVMDGPPPIGRAILVRLSDGTPVHSWSYKPVLSSVLASADLSVIAEVPYSVAYGGDVPAGHGPADSVIRRTSDGTIVRTLAGAVRSLSIDGSLAGVETNGGPGEKEIDLGSGEDVGVGSLVASGFTAAPAPGMLLAFKVTGSADPWLDYEIYVLGRGQATRLQVGYSVSPLPWFWTPFRM